MQAEFGHLDYYLMEPEMELSRGFCDFCLFPDKSAPSLSRGTMLHQIVFQFKGTELVRCEHVAEDMLQ